MKKCFIISPIGEEGTQVREHADDVYDYIIKPAVEECGIECLRSDHLHEPGKITEQMFREIFDSDVCVAVLTGHNPNVFYELALAQASGRPVVILIEKSEQLPFDIRDLRSVPYDLKPRNLFDKVYVNQLTAHFQNLERINWIIDAPFGGISIPETFGTSGARPTFYERYSAFGGTTEWLNMIDDSRERCDLMSLTLDSWKNRNGFRDLVLRKAQEGCQIRLLQMHCDNPMLRDFAADPKSYEYVGPTCRLTAEYFTALADGTANLEFRQVRRGCPHSRIIVTDDQAFMSPYLFCNGSAPVLRSTRQCSLYETIRTEFEGLWRINGE